MELCTTGVVSIMLTIITIPSHTSQTMNPAEDFTIHEKVVRGADGLFDLPNFKF